jgi:ABC-type polysaccharide/polyol phosphate export permease
VVPLVVFTSILLALFATGIALALSVLAVYFRDVGYLWAIVTQVWFFATPIVYPPTLLEPKPLNQWVNDILKLNPMNGFVEVYRRLLYDAASASQA